MELAMNINEECNLMSKVQNSLKEITNHSHYNGTAWGIVQVLYILTANATYNTVRISQESIAIEVGVSRNRISDYIGLAKKCGLIAVQAFCRCGDIRNEYTILDNPVMNSIKKIVQREINSNLEQDKRADILRAVDEAFEQSKKDGKADISTLEKVRTRIINQKHLKLSRGMANYFDITLESIIAKETAKKDALANKHTSPIKNTKKMGFCDFSQRTYDYDDLEKKLLGYDDEHKLIE